MNATANPSQLSLAVAALMPAKPEKQTRAQQSVIMKAAHAIQKAAAKKWGCRVREILFNVCLEMARAKETFCEKEKAVIKEKAVYFIPRLIRGIVRCVETNEPKGTLGVDYFETRWAAYASTRVRIADADLLLLEKMKTAFEKLLCEIEKPSVWQLLPFALEIIGHKKDIETLENKGLKLKAIFLCLRVVAVWEHWNMAQWAVHSSSLQCEYDAYVRTCETMGITPIECLNNF